MALPATGVIEIRSTATASNVNGGGFNAARGGTDYTQQNAAQLTHTDGVGTGTTNFSSASGGFTAPMVGNYLQIVSSTGLTVGWYEIVAYVDANDVTLDRTPGTGTASTYYVGGALSLGTSSDSAVFNMAVAGNIFYMKAGSYTTGGNIGPTASGGTQKPIWLIGYNATRGDNPTGASRPLFALGAYHLQLYTYWNILNLSLTGTGGVVLGLYSASKAINCKIVNSSTSAGQRALDLGEGLSNDCLIQNCEVVCYRGEAIDVFDATGTEITGCYIHDSNLGITNPYASDRLTIADNIIAGCVTAAIQFPTYALTNHVVISGNTLYGAENKLGIGVSICTGCTNIAIFNNIIYGFVTGVAHADVQTIGYDDYNDYYNNTTDVTNWQKGANCIATAPAFTAVAQVLKSGTVTSGASNLTIADTTQNFTTAGVVAGRDFFYLVSGTDVTAGIYGIVTVGTTTVVLDINPTSSSTGSSIVYQILTGRNFLPGVALAAFPGTFPGGYTTGYREIGAIQLQAGGGGGSAGILYAPGMSGGMDG